MKKDWKLLSEFLSMMRQQNNMSCDYVAAQLGISRNRLMNIEMGQREISLELLRDFSELYGFTPRNLAQIAIVEAKDKNYFYNLMKLDRETQKELKQFHCDLRIAI